MRSDPIFYGLHADPRIACRLEGCTLEDRSDQSSRAFIEGGLVLYHRAGFSQQKDVLEIDYETRQNPGITAARIINWLLEVHPDPLYAELAPLIEAGLVETA